MLQKKLSVHRCISQQFALVAFPTHASPAMSSQPFPAGFPTEVLARIMSYAFGPYREGRVVEQCWATDGPDCRGVQAKTLLPVGSIVKLQRSVLCDIGFLRALCLYDDENGIEQTGWITVETKNNFKVYIKQILSVPLSKFVRAQTNPFPKIHRARELNGGSSTTGRKKRKAGKEESSAAATPPLGGRSAKVESSSAATPPRGGSSAMREISAAASASREEPQDFVGD